MGYDHVEGLFPVDAIIMCKDPTWESRADE